MPLLERCQVCTRKGGSCGSVQAGCLMHSFPLPGSPGVAEALLWPCLLGVALPHTHTRQPPAPSLPRRA